jgi:tRNA A-37 threonylcarbamoyl transferase component Bud32
MKTTEGEGVEVRFLIRSTSRVEGHVRALGWGLGRLTSKSIIHTDLHKPNNKLGSVQLEDLWCKDEP